MGLGLQDYLRKGSDEGRGNRGTEWHDAWVKDRVGQAVIWLHTKAEFVISCNHPFSWMDTYKEKESGREKDVLRFDRWVSPDPLIVHENQYFRNDDGVLKVIPDRDPFLLLREYLRSREANDAIGLDEVVFEWDNPSKDEIVRWRRGEISGLVERGRGAFGHSLDTKIDHIYTCVFDDRLDHGVRLLRVTKMLGQKIVAEIKRLMGELGDEGNPQDFPYPFKIVSRNSRNPADFYDARKYEGKDADLTDEIRDLIESDTYPDASQYETADDGDLVKIRDAMESAARIDLPFDAIFSDDPDVRRDLVLSAAGAGKKQSSRDRGDDDSPRDGGWPSRSSRSSTSSTSSRRTSSPDGRSRRADRSERSERRPAGGSSRNSSEGRTSMPRGREERSTSRASMGQDRAPAAEPTRRRKKAGTEPPPKKPEPERVKCDDCPEMLLPSDAKCPRCGAEYDVSDAVPKASEAEAPPAATAQDRSRGVASSSDADVGDVRCWSCGADLGGNPDRCSSCGIDQGDDIPF